MGKSVISAQDKQWMGRDAARILAEAEVIKKDPVLSKLAAKEATKMAKEHQANAMAMSKIAKVATPKQKTVATSKSKPMVSSRSKK